MVNIRKLFVMGRAFTPEITRSKDFYMGEKLDVSNGQS